ncbi:deoxycytidylate deaminase, partial [Escherichia coli]|nr:deoxycytidylate deaminase [Escherichia coli]
LLDHNSELKLDEKTINKIISILKIVRKFTEEFKAELNEINSNLYVSDYQLAGKSIRRRGRIEVDFEDKEFMPKSVFNLPETINRVIKLIRKSKRDNALIVIDAIRNPYEAKFFKDRYSAFHLMSINAPD